MDHESSGDAIGIVDGTLRAYASRGVFQGVQKASAKAGAQFHFTWLYNQPFTLRFDEQRRRLALVDLLPGVERNSLMHRELKAFLQRRIRYDLPEHRRVDPARGAIASRLRAGTVSIEMTLRGQEYEYGTRTLIRVVHEVFLFLNEYWAPYMGKTFQLSME